MLMPSTGCTVFRRCLACLCLRLKKVTRRKGSELYSYARPQVSLHVLAQMHFATLLARNLANDQAATSQGNAGTNLNTWACGAVSLNLLESYI